VLAIKVSTAIFSLLQNPTKRVGLVQSGPRHPFSVFIREIIAYRPQGV
jgi:hypothetical protein